MIVLKISNASELVAAKLGQFIERLTPDQVDTSAVEEQIVNKMIENFLAEGVKGEITLLNGLEIESDKLTLTEGLKVRKHIEF